MSEFAPICISFCFCFLVSLTLVYISFHMCPVSNQLKSSFRNLIFQIIIMIALLGVFYSLSLKLSSLDMYKTMLERTLLSLGSRYIYIFFLKMGCPGVLALAIGFLVRIFSSTQDTSPLESKNVLPLPSSSSSLPSISGDTWIEQTYGEASSSVPNQDEASSSILNPAPAQPAINIPPAPAQPEMNIPPAPAQPAIDMDNLWNDLEQPLIDEGERRDQLAAKLSHRFYFRERTHRDLLRFERDLETHVQFEIELERQLRIEGYTPAALNRTREKIRDLLLYNRNSIPRKRSELNPQILQMSTSFRDSDPYSKLISARNNHNLSLYKPGELFYSLYE